MFLRPNNNMNWKNSHTRMDLIMRSKFPSRPTTDGTRQSNFAILDFTRKIALIGGTGYTGEMKKRHFSALNFILPVNKDTLPAAVLM
jgi:phosphoenolpyruvate carboxykinase (ATP)